MSKKAPISPIEPAFIKNFPLLHLPACETRSSPEELVAELMGLLFNNKDCVGKYSLEPDNEDWISNHDDNLQQFVLRAGSGRFLPQRKKNAKSDYYYSPIYPNLACGDKTHTIRPSGSKIILQFLINGVWANGLKRRSNEAEYIAMFANKVIDALAGKDEPGNILYESVPQVSEENKSKAKSLLLEKLKTAVINDLSTVQGQVKDKFSTNAVDDFLYLCDLEKKIPRPLWIQLLMTYLRYVIPIWSLTYTKSMSSFREMILNAINGKDYFDDEVINEFDNRTDKILCISTEFSRDLINKIQKYQCDRDEVFLFFTTIIENIKELSGIAEKTLVINNPANDSELSISELLLKLKKHRELIIDYCKSEYEDLSKENCLQTFISRKARKYSSYRKPAANSPKSPSTNMLYMMNCSRASAINDWRGSHLFEVKYSPEALWRVKPGPLAIQMFAHLAHSRISGRRLLFSDLLNQMESYGLDTSLEEGRLDLMDSLSSLGMLDGSPDAGTSLRLKNPLG